MKRFTGWTIAFAATALLAGPVAVSAQQTSPAPATARPEPTTPEPTASAPTAPQSATTPAQAEPAAQQAQADPDTVKRHLTAARDSLSQITQLPAAAQLTGDARTQVSQLIANFNELITTTTEWRASYTKVQANLTALVGDQAADESPATPATGTPGAVGTSGTVAIDPTIKAKLIEFRTHLLAFEKAAGGAATTSTSSSSMSSSQSQPSATNAPSAASTSATSPSEPAAATTSTASTAGSTAAPQAAAGTTGTTSSAPAAAASASTTTATEPEQSRPATAPPQSAAGTGSQQSGHAEAMRHIEAIEAILNGRTEGSATAGTTGTTAAVTTLDRDKIEEIKTHLAELRRALAQSGGR